MQQPTIRGLTRDFLILICLLILTSALFLTCFISALMQVGLPIGFAGGALTPFIPNGLLTELLPR